MGKFRPLQKKGLCSNAVSTPTLWGEFISNKLVFLPIPSYPTQYRKDITHSWSTAYGGYSILLKPTE